MKSTTLKISVAGNEFFLSCRRREKFCVGSAEDCKLSLDGEGIAPEHCEIERLSENSFVVRAIGDSETTVNGVRSREMEIAVPFILGIGPFRVTADLVDDREAEGAEEIPAERVRDGVAHFVVDYQTKKEKKRDQDRNQPQEGESPETAARRREKRPSASGREIVPGCAIPALRFGRSIRGPTPSRADRCALEGSDVPAYTSIEIPFGGGGRRKRRRDPGPLREASPLWFSTVILVHFVALAGGYGWFWWQDFTLPKRPVRLEKLAMTGDTAAMATLGMSCIRGEWGRPLEYEKGKQLVESSASRNDPFGLLAAGILRWEGHSLESESGEADELWRRAFRNGLENRLGEVRDPRWWCLAAIAGSHLGGAYSEEDLALLRKAARFGYAQAWVELARQAEPDDVARKYWRKADRAACSSIRAGSVHAMRLSGEIHHAASYPAADPELGQKRFEEAARQGDLAARVGYALLLEKEQETSAFEWMSLAAKEDFLPARADLARYFLDGVGTPEDTASALRLARETSERGSPQGRLVLAKLFADGIEVSRDLNRAELLARPLAEEGRAEARKLLGEILVRQERLADAEPFLRESAASKDATAAFALGKWLTDSDEPDRRSEGIDWLEQAKGWGSSEAALPLIEAIDRPGDPAANPERAVELLRERVREGDSACAMRLSEYFLKGRGVETNTERAAYYLQKAAEEGEQAAWFPLARLYENGADGAIDPRPSLAVEFYRKSLECEDPRIEERFAGILALPLLAVDFLESREKVRPAGDFPQVTDAMESYLHLKRPEPTQIAALEEGFRKLWPEKSFSGGTPSTPVLEDLDRIRIQAPFRFTLSGHGARARGEGNLTLLYSTATGGHREPELLRVEEEITECEFVPSRERFLVGKNTRELIPVLPVEDAVYRLANLPRKQIEAVRTVPFTDKFGRKHSLVPTSTRDGLIVFSRIDVEGDILLPEAFFDGTALESIDRAIQSHSLGVFEKEYAEILFSPNRKDPKTDILLQKADSGNHEAEAMVGGHFYDGIGGFPVDRIEAVKWFVRSARGGHPLGKNWLAVLTQAGEVQSTTSAREQFRKAIPDLAPLIAKSQVEPEYWRAMAECYAGAEGLTLRDRMPSQLLDRGVKHGDLRAQYLKGKLLLETNSTQGIPYLRYAADGRCATAAFRLAELYISDGSDPKLAFDLLQQSARKNHAPSQALLAGFYANGNAAEKDRNRAAFWFQMALWNTIHRSDQKEEVRVRQTIRSHRPEIGEDAFLRASNFLSKKGKEIP